MKTRRYLVEPDRDGFVTIEGEFFPSEQPAKLVHPFSGSPGIKFHFNRQLSNKKEDNYEFAGHLPSDHYPFRIKLTKEDLNKSENVFIKTEKLPYSKDAKKEPISSFYWDAERQVRINHKLLREHRALGESIKLENFSDFVKQQFTSENFKQFKNHYSQGPQCMLSSPFASVSANVLIPEMGLAIGEPEGMYRFSNVYEEKGKVYVKLYAEKFAVIEVTNKQNIGYLCTPIIILFELTPLGFDLISLQTDSQLVYDIYMKGAITKEMLLRELAISQWKEKFVFGCDQYKKHYETLERVRKTHNEAWCCHVDAISEKMDEKLLATELEKYQEISDAILQQWQRKLNRLEKQHYAPTSIEEVLKQEEKFNLTFPIRRAIPDEVRQLCKEEWQKRVKFIVRHNLFESDHKREAKIEVERNRFSSINDIVIKIFSIRSKYAIYDALDKDTASHLDKLEKKMVNAVNHYRQYNSLSRFYEIAIRALTVCLPHASENLRNLVMEVKSEIETLLQSSEMKDEAKHHPLDEFNTAQTIMRDLLYYSPRKSVTSHPFCLWSKNSDEGNLMDGLPAEAEDEECTSQPAIV